MVAKIMAHSLESTIHANEVSLYSDLDLFSGPVVSVCHNQRKHPLVPFPCSCSLWEWQILIKMLSFA